MVLAESRMLSFLSCTRGGLERGFGLKSLFPNIEGLDVQFQCQLHPCALILIFGSFAGSLVHMLRALVRLPGGLGRFLPGRTGAIIVG